MIIVFVTCYRTSHSLNLRHHKVPQSRPPLKISFTNPNNAVRNDSESHFVQNTLFSYRNPCWKLLASLLCCSPITSAFPVPNAIRRLFGTPARLSVYRTALIVVHCRTRNFCHRIIQCGFSPFYKRRTHHTAVHTSIAQPAVPDPISRCGVGYTNMPYTRLCRHILCPWFVKLLRASIILS